MTSTLNVGFSFALKSSIAICVAKTDPFPAKSEYVPDKSVNTPILTTPLEILSSASAGVTHIEANVVRTIEQISLRFIISLSIEKVAKNKTSPFTQLKQFLFSAIFLRIDCSDAKILMHQFCLRLQLALINRHHNFAVFQNVVPIG